MLYVLCSTGWSKEVSCCCSQCSKGMEKHDSKISNSLVLDSFRLQVANDGIIVKCICIGTLQSLLLSSTK